MSITKEAQKELEVEKEAQAQESIKEAKSKKNKYIPNKEDNFE